MSSAIQRAQARCPGCGLAAKRRPSKCVHQRERFLGLEPQRLEPGFGQGGAGVDLPAAMVDLPLAHQRRSQVRERRQIAARAHRSLRRDARQDAVAEQVAEPLQHFAPHRRPAAAQGSEPHRDHRRRLEFREQAAGAAAVESDQVGLQICRQLRGHRRLARVADAGVDAVDGLARAQLVGDRLDAAVDAPLPGGVARQARGLGAAGQLQQLLDGQPLDPHLQPRLHGFAPQKSKKLNQLPGSMRQ